LISFYLMLCEDLISVITHNSILWSYTLLCGYMIFSKTPYSRFWNLKFWWIINFQMLKGKEKVSKFIRKKTFQFWLLQKLKEMVLGNLSTKVVCLFCLSCWELPNHNMIMASLSMLLVPLESLWWIGVHQVGLIIFQFMIETFVEC